MTDPAKNHLDYAAIVFWGAVLALWGGIATTLVAILIVRMEASSSGLGGSVEAATRASRAPVRKAG